MWQMNATIDIVLSNTTITKFFNNVRDTNILTKIFTNCWCDEWLLVNEKVILMVSLDENQ